MRLILALTFAIAATLSACATPPPRAQARFVASDAAASQPERMDDFIEIAMRPCDGECPAFEARVLASGDTRWVGAENVALEGAHVLQLGPEAFANLSRVVLANQRQLSLGEIQPGSSPLCYYEATNMPSYEIAFALGARRGALNIYGGCGGPTSTAALRAVARLLLALERNGAPIGLNRS